MKVGDIVLYKKDWIPGRKWYLYSMMKNDLCTIVLLRDDNYKHMKAFSSAGHTWTEEYLNASIVNLDINEIEKI